MDATLPLPLRAPPLDFTAVRDAHLEFVWLTLQRFGVREADLDDAVQEVFVVVHLRLGEFDGRAKVSTWLFAIARRVAMAYRRREARREVSMEALPDPPSGPEFDPEQAAARQEARQRLEAILDEIDPDKRAVFVMFEVEGLECDAIAEMTGVPVGTVHSRLHHARKAFERSLARSNARDANRRVR